MTSTFNSTSNKVQSIDLSDILVIPTLIRFWFFLIFNILSVFCSFFVLFYLLFDRILRQALHNHAIIIILLLGLAYELTTVPLMLYYYHAGNAWRITDSFSHFWTFIDYVCFTAHLMGFAWASVERHILIFRHQWMSTTINRFFIHYLPLITLLGYCFVYHFALILFPFCVTSIAMSPFNGVPVPCILSNPVFIKWDAICHQIIPTFIIGISSITLLLRVVQRKTRLNQSIRWRKQRKMIIQLLSISTLYFIFMSPRMAAQFCILIGFSTDGVMTVYFHGAFFAVYVVFLFPFVCYGSMPELRKKLINVIAYRKQSPVVSPVGKLC